MTSQGGYDITGWLWHHGGYDITVANNVKMRKLLDASIIGYYNGSFQMKGGWLKVIILKHVRKMT